jgi:hypothetical protein
MTAFQVCGLMMTGWILQDCFGVVEIAPNFALHKLLTAMANNELEDQVLESFIDICWSISQILNEAFQFMAQMI